MTKMTTGLQGVKSDSKVFSAFCHSDGLISESSTEYSTASRAQSLSGSKVSDKCKKNQTKTIILWCISPVFQSVGLRELQNGTFPQLVVTSSVRMDGEGLEMIGNKN